MNAPRVFSSVMQRISPKWRWAAIGFLLVAFALQIMSGWRVKAQTALGPQINLDRYTATFDGGFDNLSVSPRGPNTKWIAHTPWNGDFGDAGFADPSPGFPFTVTNGALRIEAHKDEKGKWSSGLLSSRSADGTDASGFAQQYGYFEMRAKLPPGPGTWPAFWLIGVDKSKYSSEIDVIEQYGAFPDIYRLGAQIHRGKAPPEVVGAPVTIGDHTMSEEFNTYGVSIDPDVMKFYFNRHEVWSTPTTPEFRQPFYILVDLALGAGWPIDKTPNPSFMYVDYVRAYKKL